MPKYRRETRAVGTAAQNVAPKEIEGVTEMNPLGGFGVAGGKSPNPPFSKGGKIGARFRKGGRSAALGTTIKPSLT